MNDKGFQEFAEEIKERITDYMPSGYENSEVRLSTTRKVNRDVTYITVVPKWAEESIVPTIHIDSFYEAYLHGRDIDLILSDLSETIDSAYKTIDTDPLTAQKSITELQEDKVYFQLINTESNRHYLENIPHRELHDMSLIYRVLFKKEKDGIQSVVVTDDIRRNWGISEDRLFEIASVNTKELFPPVIQSMSEVMTHFLGGDLPGIGVDEMDEVMGTSPLWLVSNDIGVNGASMMVYSDILDKVADKIDDNIYVIPSSLHEILAVPSSQVDPEEIADMVRDINQHTVREEDRLSNQVFHYDRNARELTVASDSPVKGILDREYAAPAKEEKKEFARGALGQQMGTAQPKPVFAR